ncbi:hypothetical protein SPRG_02649 [Saprolegnia parasitica CBS 223.65]|uniref:Uncharacterized protein n=1 Tax=Saprolegnia parasitica (strain CBS 223.65) TaxID=695850 RepID=A0A067D2G2_SAPPC|nr:hypothetical protein SPRG_02649 [Saprolegnia parasitica CBS 223.65]KDO32956.1 hypothetical protein SPRG_02649 [Saprolegnia parasitica CBS 223.65]|eukprot:XP_012196603.1 hypothetical protein SPRG_02649 [Saprolegnia parasitica CBS 223.65]
MHPRTPKRKPSVVMAQAGYANPIDMTTGAWSVPVPAPVAPPMHPKVQACANEMRHVLELNKAQVEKTMRSNYEKLLRSIDAEIEETNQKLELFQQVNNAIYEKCTKRLKRLADVAAEEMEEVQKQHAQIFKDTTQVFDKAKQKSLRDFKAEADKILQTVK